MEVAIMKKWLCKVCGYIYEGPEAPAECPVCHAKSNMFEEVKGELKLAAEHEFGVYGKTVKNNPDIESNILWFSSLFIPNFPCSKGLQQ